MKTKISRQKRIIIIIASVAVVLLIDFTITGFLKFSYNFVRCGGMPVKITVGGFAAANSVYGLPGHYTPGGAGAVYLCTEQEAIDRQIPKDLYN